MRLLRYDHGRQFINTDQVESATLVRICLKYYIKLNMHSTQAAYIGPFYSKSTVEDFMNEFVAILSAQMPQYFPLSLILKNIKCENTEVDIHFDIEKSKYVK